MKKVVKQNKMNMERKQENIKKNTTGFDQGIMKTGGKRRENIEG